MIENTLKSTDTVLYYIVLGAALCIVFPYLGFVEAPGGIWRQGHGGQHH